MSATRQAPWTEAEVAALSRTQAGPFHPFTCPNRSEGHTNGVLTPTAQGWACPECDYTQDWAHDFMVDAHLWV